MPHSLHQPCFFIQRHWMVISALLLTLITISSLMPAEHLPPVPGTDKTHHFVAYAALIFPCALRAHKYFLLLAIFFILWSGGIELIQPYMNRYGEWLDLLANSGGILIGSFLGVFIRRQLPASNK